MDDSAAAEECAGGPLSPEERIALRLAAALGVEADTASALHGGNQNHVIRLTGRHRDVVVRFARDDSRMIGDPVDVEAWCAHAVAPHAISTPGIVERGHVVVDWGAARTGPTPWMSFVGPASRNLTGSPNSSPNRPRRSEEH